MNDPVCEQVGGEHYKDLPIQPIDYIYKNGLGFVEGSIIKYVTRWKRKNGVQDLRKAESLIKYLIDITEFEQPEL